MTEFFEGMDPLLRTFWYIALPSSLVFIIQSVMTFLGTDAGDGVEADFDSDLDGAEAPFQLYSLRNLINFLLGFSWSGISFYEHISSTALLIGLSAAVGALFVVLFFLIIRQMLKLSEDNSFRMEECVGKTAEVYSRIPGKKSGKGKVTLSVRGSARELDAVTDGEEINSGTMVKVLEVLSDNILRVE